VILRGPIISLPGAPRSLGPALHECLNTTRYIISCT